MNELTVLENQLQSIIDIQQIVNIYNQAESYRYAFRQARGDPEDRFKASVIKLRAARRAGEILCSKEKAKGGLNGRNPDGSLRLRIETTETYAELGINKVQAQ